ncbi:MAG: condensation domain-containing protein [Paracoccus sp. (in: a-proteobacteria)]|uniref:condensation domain-containing protein n=1 Tax=Paracoccus sp. TaxID=267 RepID=UPI0026E02104|nr:condensation domain-containing protein [Paracoccus sp. (in: a-proteobacteria)]MDO5611880.1 condensation domain-containing protein [Paracoccus sp. (in: a-proteobacteria)]
MSDRIQDILPLAPGQGGMVFHAIGGGAPGDDVIQIVVDMTGTPDLGADRAVWDALVARHDALRTAFVWQGQKQPLQVVGRRAALQMVQHDLTAMAGAAQSAHLSDWLTQDRAQGFDLTRAPLMRVACFALAPDRQRLVVTFHHAILDGWSIPVLLREWVTLRAGRSLPDARPARDHVAWALAQDRAAARDFWRAELAGYVPPRAALPTPDAPPVSRRGDISLRLDPGQTQALTRAARASGVTLATAIQGAWALFLARSAGADDVVWGLARAGRPAALAGAETRVGMFLTTLPMRAALPADQPLSAFLANLQARQTRQAPHEHLPLTDVLAAANQRGGALMQTAVVFENYPADPARLGDLPGLTITGVQVFEQPGLGLTLYVIPGDGLTLRLIFDAAVVSHAAARLVLVDLHALLVLPHDTRLHDIAVQSRATMLRQAPAPRPPGAARPALPALAAIWADVLAIPTPAAADNFFDLGGHSLLAITLQDRIRRDLGIEVQIADLFRHATLGAQSAHLAGLNTPLVSARADDTALARQTGANRLRQRRAQTMKDRHHA